MHLKPNARDEAACTGSHRHYNQSGYMSIQPTPWQSILLCLPGLIQVRFEITGHMVQPGLSPLSHTIRVGPIWQTVQNVPANHVRSDKKKKKEAFLISFVSVSTVTLYVSADICRCPGFLGSVLTMSIWGKPVPRVTVLKTCAD